MRIKGAQAMHKTFMQEKIENSEALRETVKKLKVQSYRQDDNEQKDQLSRTIFEAADAAKDDQFYKFVPQEVEGKRLGNQDDKEDNFDVV